MVDVAALFQEMECALREEERLRAEQHASDTSSCGTCSVESDEDCHEDKFPVFYLSNGGVHVCKGHHCEHLVMNEDHMYVCKYTGIVHGIELAVDTVESVSGHKPSNCPDDHAGEPVGGQWKPKKDMFQLSQHAYLVANQMDESKGSIYVDKASFDKQSVPKQLPKRGARCVDDPAPQKQTFNKRTRHKPPDKDGKDSHITLVDDAVDILCKLVNFDRKPTGKTTKKAHDSRLLDKDFLFSAAVKRYVKECLATGHPPTLDAVHNLSILSRNVALEERKKMEEASHKVPNILHPTVKKLCCELVVALWTAGFKTHYMTAKKRGSDSFRPFACGVFYALKRGVTLPNGRIIIPALPSSFTGALPALRSTADNSVAKTLHSSSHRGLCTLHRSVSSLTPENTHIFNEAAVIASKLISATKSIAPKVRS